MFYSLRIIATTVIMVLGFSLVGWSQSVLLPSDHPIAIAAPHLPALLKYDGVGKAIYGDKYSYKREENMVNIKEWIRNYPEEVTKYKAAINEYLKHADPSLLSGNDKELYHELKSQWMMVSQM